MSSFIAADEKIAKAGVLNKKGDVNRNWKARYFVLRSGFLYYYQDQRSKAPQGIISLDGAVVEEVTKSTKLYGFQIQTHAKSIQAQLQQTGQGRVYYLEAKDEEDKNEWTKAIQVEIQLLQPHHEDNGSSGGGGSGAKTYKKAGWMQKKGGVTGGARWQKRWFVLNADKLSYYTKPEEKIAKGVIDLAQGYVVPKSATNRPLCFQVITITNDGKVHRICDVCAKAGRSQTITSDAWEHKDNVSKCTLCSKKFSVLAPKQNCRRCGRIVCGKCSQNKVPLEVPRTYYLEPESAVDRGSWVVAISANCGHEEMKSMIKSGYLMARVIPSQGVGSSSFIGGGGSNQSVIGVALDEGAPREWMRLYFVLRPGRLSYYTRLKDHFPPERPRGQIPLHPACLVWAMGGSGNGAATLSAAAPDNNNNEHQNAFCIEVGSDKRKITWLFDIPPPPPKGAKGGEEEDELGAVGVGAMSDEENGNGGADPDHNSHLTPLDQLGEWVHCIAQTMPFKVFDVPLALAAERTDKEGLVPSPVRIAVEWLNAHGLTEEGLYRIPGSKDQVEALIQAFDRGEDVQIPDQFHPGNCASLIVQYFKRCPENMFSDKLAPVFAQVMEDSSSDMDKKLKMLRKLITMMPAPNRSCVQLLTNHLRQVAKHSDINSMTAEKLAMCVYTKMAKCIQTCIQHHDDLFGSSLGSGGSGSTAGKSGKDDDDDDDDDQGGGVRFADGTGDSTTSKKAETKQETKQDSKAVKPKKQASFAVDDDSDGENQEKDVAKAQEQEQEQEEIKRSGGNGDSENQNEENNHNNPAEEDEEFDLPLPPPPPPEE